MGISKQSLQRLPSLPGMPTVFAINYQAFWVYSVEAIAVAFRAIHTFFNPPVSNRGRCQERRYASPAFTQTGKSLDADSSSIFTPQPATMSKP